MVDKKKSSRRLAVEPRRKHTTAAINLQLAHQYLTDREKKEQPACLMYFIHKFGSEYEVVSEVFFDSRDHLSTVAELVAGQLGSLEGKMLSRDAATAAHEFYLVATGCCSQYVSENPFKHHTIPYWSGGRIFNAPVLLVQGKRDNLEKISEQLSKFKSKKAQTLDLHYQEKPISQPDRIQ